MTDTELSFCPFCGETERLTIEEDEAVSRLNPDWVAPFSYIIHCGGCGAVVGFIKPRDETIEKWNTRAYATKRGF